MTYCFECRRNYEEGFLYCPIHKTDLKKQPPETELINSVQNRILAAENASELFAELTRIMTNELHAKIFTLYLYDPINSQLILRAATGIPDKFIGKLSYKIEANKGRKYLTSWLFESGKAFFSDDIRKIKYDSDQQCFISDLSADQYYIGNFVTEYYEQIKVPYEKINPISFMGAALVRPGTNEKLGVIKAELKIGENNDESFEPFTEKEYRIFNAIIPGISLAVHLAHRLNEIKILRDRFEHAFKIIMRVYMETLKVKDEFTFQHSKRVAKYASMLGETFFEKGKAESAMLLAGALLHDLGKKNIRRDILQKTASLTENEMNEMKFHPEAGVSIYYEQFRDSLDDLSWLFIVLLHHTSRDMNKSYPQIISKANSWCCSFVRAFGLDPEKEILNQLEMLRGKIYLNYNEKVRAIYSYASDDELERKYDNLQLMVDIVRAVDCIDAGAEIRAYQFDPKNFDYNVSEILRAPRGEYDPRVLQVLEDKSSQMKEICERNDFNVMF